jgi:hypothetical protein
VAFSFQRAMRRRVAAVAFGLTCRDSLPAAGLGKLGNVASRNDVRAEIRQFLTTRRAKLTPDQAGLSTYGRNRRVPGLRREEVALLAGISIGYYTRLERGNARGVSEKVLDGITRARPGRIRHRKLRGAPKGAS